jgi:cytochrome c55X
MVDVADVEDVVGVAILALRAVVGAVVLAGAAGAGLAAAQSASTPSNAPSPERQATLVRMVRQDCGSCHGMRLTGGLGPALTPQALEGKPLLSMASTIYGGRPGTPMPGWSAMLTQDEAQWVAQQLANGFPEEPRRPAR